MKAIHIIALAAIGAGVPDQSAMAQNPYDLAAAELVRRYADIGDLNALLQVFAKCPAASARSDSLLVGVMQWTKTREQVMTVAAGLVGGNASCNDSRVNAWIRERMWDTASPAALQAELAEMLLILDAAGGEKLVEEWLFARRTDADAQERVLVQLAEELLNAERLDLFIRSFGSFEMPERYLANELSHFRRTDFDGSRRRMLRALRQNPGAPSAQRLIETISPEITHLAPEGSSLHDELTRTLEELSRPDGAAPPRVQSAARSALQAQVNQEGTTALGLSIVDAILMDIGRGPDAAHPPRAGGPVLLDRESFESSYSWRFDSTAAAAFTDTLAAAGYAFATSDTLIRNAPGRDGMKEYWLDDDAILVHLMWVNRHGNSAEALVTYLYTHRLIGLQTVCPRTIEIQLHQTGLAEWKTQEIRRLRDC